MADEDIITLIMSSHSNKYFEEIYKRYHHKVFEKCLGLVRNKDTAQELAEEIFSKVLEKLKGFRGLSSFSSWLYSITYNHCIDYLRAKKNLHYPSWNEENQIPEILDETEDLQYDISYEKLEIILDLIHPEEKALLLMKYKDSLSIKQISNALRISDDAAKMRLKRARTRVLYLYKQKFLS
jgi:RNA polymerase sigma-70 factor (ECF subfamily)